MGGVWLADPDDAGGYLGYNCSHAYPHTSRTKLNFLAPDNLKGADMLMYEIFRSLGLKVSFRPVVTDLHYSDEGGDARPVVGLELPWAMWGFLDDSELQETYDEWTGKVPGAYMKRHRWYWTRDRTRTRQPEPEPEPTPLPEYVRFEDIHWLNDLGHREPQISWTAVSGRSPGPSYTVIIWNHSKLRR
jgi:hypothetical protein